MKRKMPTLNALKAFEVAASLGSFTRASADLNVTQSAVSRQVRHLEEQLGKALLQRHHHCLEMTDAGRTLLHALQQSFDRIELAVQAIQRNEPANRLRINAPPTFALRWLLPRLENFHRKHPQLEVTLTTAPQDTLAETTELDCAIRFGLGEWESVDNSLLMHEQHIAVCSPTLAERHGDLSNMTLLHVLSDEKKRYMTWPHWLDAAGLRDVDLRGGYEFDLLDMAIRAAVDGLGITMADRHMVSRELVERRLVQFSDVQIEGHQAYWFVTRKHQPVTAPVESFRAWLRQELDVSMQIPAQSITGGIHQECAATTYEISAHHSFFE